MGSERSDRSDSGLVPLRRSGLTINHRAVRIARCAAIILLLGAATGPVRSETVQQFWNTSTRTFTGVFLAPAGSNRWGPNQAANDPDGSVSADERLKLTDVPAGRLDVRLIDNAGRTCVVRGVEVTTGRRYAFAIGDDELVHCRQGPEGAK